MENGKGKNRDLTEREMDILFVLDTLRDVPEKAEILEELELARREEKGRGQFCRAEMSVKKGLERLQRKKYLRESMEIAKRGGDALKNRGRIGELQKLSLNWAEILEVVWQREIM